MKNTYSKHQDLGSISFTAWQTKTLLSQTVPAGTYYIGYYLSGYEGFASQGICHMISINQGTIETGVKDIYVENNNFFITASGGLMLIKIDSSVTLNLTMSSSSASSGKIMAHLYIWRRE